MQSRIDGLSIDCGLDAQAASAIVTIAKMTQTRPIGAPLSPIFENNLLKTQALQFTFPYSLPMSIGETFS
jgi:hypothetical protein